MAKKTNNLSEARKHLDDFASKCAKSKVLAHELGLAQSEEKMNQLLGETVLVAAKAHLDEAVNISGSDMNKAKAVALEAAEILRNHPIPQPFEAARASILNTVNEFVRKGVTTVPPTPDAKGTPPTADAGAAGPADSDAVNRIVASAEKLLSKKKYAEARKAAAELVKLAKERSDADLEKRAGELVDKIRAKEFKGFDKSVDAAAKKLVLDEKKVDVELQDLIDKEAAAAGKEADAASAMKRAGAGACEVQKKVFFAKLEAARGDSHEVELLKKRITSMIGGIIDNISEQINAFPSEYRENVITKKLQPTNHDEMLVLMFNSYVESLTSLIKEIIDWK